MASNNVSRTIPQLYRDCLRLVEHIAGKSAKAQKLRGIIGNEFRKNAHITDPLMIEGLKSGAIRGLSNYLMMESSSKDQRFKNHMNAFHDNETKNIKESSSSMSSNSSSNKNQADSVESRWL